MLHVPIDPRRLALPSRLAEALVSMIVRTIGLKSTDASRGFVHDALTTLFAGHPNFGDLRDIHESDLADAFSAHTEDPVPGPRLRAVIRLLERFEPTTPVCTNCSDVALTDIGGSVRELEPGSACPHCRKGYLEIVPMVLGRLNWVTGEIVEAGITTDFRTRRGLMIPVTDERIREWVSSIDTKLENACTTHKVPLYGVLALMNLERSAFRREDEGEWFLQDPSEYGIRSQSDYRLLMRDVRLLLDRRETTNLPRRQLLSNGRVRSDYWPLRIGGRTYLVEGLIGRGSKTDILRGRWDHDPTEQVIIKLLVSPDDKDLLDAEIRNVQLLGRSDERGSEIMKSRVPTLVMHGLAELPGNVQFPAVVYRYQHGLDWTLADVMEAYPRGVGGRTLVWMCNRLLLQMSWWHDTGLVHGNILPEHLIIHPRDHLMAVVGWDSALRVGQRQRRVVQGRKPLYAPEIVTGEPVSVHTDVAMACRTMIAVAGGNVTEGTIPSRIPYEVALLLRRHARYDEDGLHASAWDVYDQIKAAARSVYGPPKYHSFHMWPTDAQVIAEYGS